LGILILLAGCATNKTSQPIEAARPVASIQTTRQELTRAQVQVDEVLAAMDQLAAAPAEKLPRTYYAFADRVSQTVSQADTAHRRAVQMRERWQQYVGSWEKEIEQLAHPELRTGAEGRGSVRENYDRLRDAAGAMEAAYGPFVTQLRDLQGTLSLDLTAGGQAARPAFAIARKDAAELKQQIASFIAEIDQVLAISPPRNERRSDG
jgi:hypothetical protein